MENIHKTKCIQKATLESGLRIRTTIQESLYRKAWFAGLYIASLLCLSVTGASVRWMLYYL